MKSARAIVLFAALAATLLLSGCLATEYKLYRCKLNADGTGSGTITFQNIFSQDDDEKDVSTSDFDELITEYLNGSKFEDDTPRIHVTGKRLYEEDGKLMGEVSYDFTNADSAGFILGKGCPVIFIPGVDNETVIESNGTVHSVATPYLTWPAGTTDMWYKVTTDTDTTGSRSLLALYRAWKSTGQKE